MASKKFLFVNLLLIIGISLFVGEVSLAETKVDLYFFYSQSCPICQSAESFLSEMARKYPSLEIKSFEIFSNPENRSFYLALGRAYNLDLSDFTVPTIFIDEKVFTTYSSMIAAEIEQTIIKCSSMGCVSPIEKLKLESPHKEDRVEGRKIINRTLAILVILILIFLFIKIISKKSKLSKNV